jgi:mannose/fructose/N-acetylgalactosamine-specific phosphotransferase system component IIC
MGETLSIPEGAQVVLLLLLGGIAALDGTAVCQFMISRPLVSGTLAGLLLGDPATGLLVGSILEGANLGAIPIGASRFLEPGPAAIPAAVAAIGFEGGGGIALGVGLGMVMSLLGGESIVLQRRWNGHLLAGIHDIEKLSRRFWGCIAMDGARGIALTGVGIGLVLLLPPSMVAHWQLDRTSTVALLLLPSALAVGALLDRWRLTPRRWAIFATALACGLALGGLS